MLLATTKIVHVKRNSDVDNFGCFLIDDWKMNFKQILVILWNVSRIIRNSCS